MVGRNVVAALCVMLLFLVACESKPKVSEPIDPARVDENRYILRQCRDYVNCTGGFAIGGGRIRRLVGGDELRFETIGIKYLLDAPDEVINRFEEFVLPGNHPRWDKVAVAYSLQFTPIPGPY